MDNTVTISGSRVAEPVVADDVGPSLRWATCQVTP